jgi:adenosylmethionine-8-amino-7-oxononanoate aminotransferase
VIGFVAETVVGATAGAVPPTPGYFRGVRKLCDQYGLLLILDEVMCGMGRCGTLYAFEQEGVLPDLVVLGKGLGAGYQPVGAVLARAHIVQRLRDGSGAFQHGHTYMGHPVAAAAALAVQNVIRRDNLLGAVTVRGAALRRMLRAFGDHPHVGDIRGRGLLIGLELVADRDSKAPFDPALRCTRHQGPMARGLMVYPMGGTIDGRRGDHTAGAALHRQRGATGHHQPPAEAATRQRVFCAGDDFRLLLAQTGDAQAQRVALLQEALRLAPCPRPAGCRWR